MPPTNDSPARVALGTYTDAERATQAEARLQTTGLWTAREPAPSAADPPASNNASAHATQETVVLYVRSRDVRKARGVLQAVHLQPDATPGAAADTEPDAKAEAETGPRAESTADPDGGSTDEGGPATADWMPHIRFTHMVIGGAIVLALATALFLWMQTSAG